MATLLLRTLSASCSIGKSEIGYMSVYLMQAVSSTAEVVGAWEPSLAAKTILAETSAAILTH
jgi:hypothetical protein